MHDKHKPRRALAGLHLHNVSLYIFVYVFLELNMRIFDAFKLAHCADCMFL